MPSRSRGDESGHPIHGRPERRATDAESEGNWHDAAQSPHCCQGADDQHVRANKRFVERANQYQGHEWVEVRIRLRRFDQAGGIVMMELSIYCARQSLIRGQVRS